MNNLLKMLLKLINQLRNYKNHLESVNFKYIYKKN